MLAPRPSAARERTTLYLRPAQTTTIGPPATRSYREGQEFNRYLSERQSKPRRPTKADPIAMCPQTYGNCPLCLSISAPASLLPT